MVINSNKLDKALHLTVDSIKETTTERTQEGKNMVLLPMLHGKKTTLEALHKAKGTTNLRELQTYATLHKEYKALLKNKWNAQLEIADSRSSQRKPLPSTQTLSPPHNQLHFYGVVGSMLQ
jgi:hypothetical protein